MSGLILMHGMIVVTLITSAAGTICILRGQKIVNLGITLRNCMYVGACTAMCFGFLGAQYCLESIILTPLHFVAAAVLIIVGLFATMHITVDLHERLRFSH